MLCCVLKETLDPTAVCFVTATDSAVLSALRIKQLKCALDDTQLCYSREVAVTLLVRFANSTLRQLV